MNYRVTSYSAHRSIVTDDWTEAKRTAGRYALEGNLPASIEYGDNRWTVQPGCEPCLMAGTVNIGRTHDDGTWSQFGVMDVNTAIATKINSTDPKRIVIQAMNGEYIRGTEERI